MSVVSILAVLLTLLDLLAVIFTEPMDGDRQDALRLLGLGILPEIEQVLVLGRAHIHSFFSAA